MNGTGRLLQAGWIAALALGAAGCATRIHPPGDSAAPVLQVQQRVQLTPLGEGIAAQAEDLQTGDILLSSTQSLVSLGIRAFTLSPVSHAALYVGDGQVVEAVGAGVQQRPLADYLAGESTVAAFRHPDISAEQAQRLQTHARSLVGKPYSPVGIVLQAPFTVQRRYCELPVVPGFVRDLCVRGLGTVTMGAARNDRFFCSQLVLHAYQAAGLPLTSADPRLISPADLLHMREGDVPSVKTEQALQYIGHLKLTGAPADQTVGQINGPGAW
jgi:cell wall-associated NlpC family hydrolase